MFFFGGGLWATSTDPLTLQKKPKKPNTNQKKQHIPQKKPRKPNTTKNRNQNIATWFVKQQQQEQKKNTEIQNQQKERPTQENKGFESKCKKPKKPAEK